MMKKIKRLLLNDGVQEMLRYGIVGGISFLVDISLLYFMREYIFPHGQLGVYYATMAGFLGGLTVNTLLSVQFVFRQQDVVASKRGKNVKDIIQIFIIGFTGLLLTEAGMFVGTEICAGNYLLVKVVVTGAVFVWNYLGRKFFVFRPSDVLVEALSDR
ncbi:GtrA family protein [Anaerovibrio sp.]|uniref:GtrA family protein n=1 Tax=Anaerovibrio sp. TaxID=1872532 RepID=UPI003F13FED9